MRIAKGRRDGIALAVALFTMVVIAALIAGVFFTATQEYRTGRNTLAQERAMAAAEFGQNMILARWDKAKLAKMKVGDTLFQINTLSGGVVDTVRATKLSQTALWVVSTARTSGDSKVSARRRTGTLVTIDIPDVRVPAAVVSRGADSVGGSSVTNGNDQNPSGWDCPAAGPPAPSYATPDSTMKYFGNSYQLQGASPTVAKNPLAGDTNTYFNPTGGGWSDMTGMATITYNNTAGLSLSQIGPVVSGTSCVTTNTNNWGDPARNLVTPGPCESYFPVIYSKGPGALSISGGGGGGGQGILLVDGDLNISGNWEFKGLVIVRGRANLSGNGVKIMGALMTANLNGKYNVITGSTQPSFSRCVLTTVLAAQGALPRRMKERAWADVY